HAVATQGVDEGVELRKAKRPQLGGDRVGRAKTLDCHERGEGDDELGLVIDVAGVEKGGDRRDPGDVLPLEARAGLLAVGVCLNRQGVLGSQDLEEEWKPWSESADRVRAEDPVGIAGNERVQSNRLTIEPYDRWR